MQIEKLKSGNYRARVFIKRDASGKKITKSFTASTKKELTYIVAQYMSTNHPTNGDTVESAVIKFLESAKERISPTTYRTYDTFYRTRFDDLKQKKISNLTVDMIQKQIDYERNTIVEKTKQHPSYKYIRDCTIFYLEAIKKADRNAKFEITEFDFGKKVENHMNVPTEEQMNLILEKMKGNKIELPVLLACQMSLRTSEIRGLKWDDINGDFMHIQRAKVLNDTIKETKTKTSDRIIKITPDVKDVLERTPHTSDFIIPNNHSFCYDNFDKFLKDNNLPHFSFHSLRHYFASYCLGKIDTRFIEYIGGWSHNSPILTRTYQEVWLDKVSTETDKLFKK